MKQNRAKNLHRNSSQGERQPECSQCIWRKYYQDEVSRRLIAEQNNNTYIKVSIFFFIPINRNLKKRGKRGNILRGKLLGYNKRSIDLTSFFANRGIRLNSGSHLDHLRISTHKQRRLVILGLR